jgi:ABC-type branched-subunit amino acid transport system ATPase component/ABC-type branched-subunit amino acid transport system permease subunit
MEDKFVRVRRFLAPDLIGIYLLSIGIVLIPLLTGNLHVQHLCVISGIYIILLSGFNLCAGVTGLVSFGHGALYALGAYSTVLFVTKAGWPWIPSMAAGIITALVGGAIFAATGYRAKAFYLGLSTLACGWIVFKVLWNWIDLTGGQPGIPVPVASIWRFELWESELSYVIAGSVLFSLVVTRNIMHSRTGRALKSISANEVVASAVGVNVPKYKFMIFLVSAFFAGLAGIFYAYFSFFIDPEMSSVHTSFSFVVILVIGGWATIFGPILGTIIYVFFPAYLGFLKEYWSLLWAVVLISILLLTPQGLWGIICKYAAKLPFPRLRTSNLQWREIYEGAWNGAVYQANDDPVTFEVIKLCKNFGGLQALKNVDLTIKGGRIHALIGPNGAGKTTLINIITGFYPPDNGEIILEGKRIDTLPPHRITDLGIARTFQGAKICEGMTVLDNVRLGQHTRTRAGIFSSAFGTSFVRQEERQFNRKAYESLKYVDLIDVALEPAENMGDGQRRALEIARALASNPKILILDEPMAGLTHEEVMAIMRKLRELRDQGLAIFLIEHHMEAVMAVSDIITVLDFGMKIAEGRPQEIRNNEDVIRAYLGKQGMSVEC